MRTREPWTAIVSSLLMLTILVPKAAADEPKPTLAELLKSYKEFGLPLPPKEVQLVRYEGAMIGNGMWQSVPPRTFRLALQIKPANKTNPPTLRIDFYDELPTWEEKLVLVEPTKKAAVGIDPKWFPLILAIQCHALGWDELAQALFEKGKPTEQAVARQVLLEEAWNYWYLRLTKAKTDRIEIAKRLKDLINRDKSLDTDFHRELLRSLDLALVPSRAKPGSIEALIDDLVEYHGPTTDIENRLNRADERYTRIANLGFKAVPALIEHLDDDRLTRDRMMQFNNFGGFHLHARHVVSDLLEGLAGTQVSLQWIEHINGTILDRKQVSAWWRKVEKEDEETYLLKHFLDPDGQFDVKRGERIREHRVGVFLAKYPKRIPELYKAVLDKQPKFMSLPLSVALLESNLPKKEKIELFVHATKNKSWVHQVPALNALRKLDSERFNEVLMRLIADFPIDTDEKYGNCSPPNIAVLAIHCDDPRIWPLLEKVIRRSSIGLRTEMLHWLSYAGSPNFFLHRKDVLALLDRFLLDSALRDARSDRRLYHGGAGFGYDKIEVRDVVALSMARLLHIKLEPNPQRTPEEWAQIRTQVREAVRREMAMP